MSAIFPEGTKTQAAEAPEATATVEAALDRALELLRHDPGQAIAQTEEILRLVPDHPMVLFVKGMAQRAAGQAELAVATLEPLVAQQPKAVFAWFELGMAQFQLGQLDSALVSLRRAVELKPEHADAWRAIGDICTINEDVAGADAAYAAQIRASTRDPRLLRPAAALCANDIATAEPLLRDHLRQYPTDVVAMRMLAEVAGRLRRYPAAETLLMRCIELAPGFHAARQNLALVLSRQNRFVDAMGHVQILLEAEPLNAAYRNLQATVLSRIGEHEQSLRIYEQVLAGQPGLPGIWMNYGHVLSTAGREQESVQAYRNSIDLAPNFGEAYWSLANLKTYRFTPGDVAQMEGRLARGDLNIEDRYHLHFAIGKAQEDARQYEESFRHYAEGNRLRRSVIRYDADEMHAFVLRSKTLLTQSFFAQREGYGNDAPDPIFILGLPRAGSTLLEQILGSHSSVEGTIEHPDIAAMAKRLGAASRKAGGAEYPELLAAIGPEECRNLGTQYLDSTRLQRKTGRPFFIDKMPNNFLHIGLIALILPRARIIDARRNPMACCFSGFKQHFARGQHFSYSLADIGRYYVDYVDLMRHFDSALPGRIHRVIYEEMVEDTDTGVRRLLDFCGLPFEESCLRFYENARAVRTASAQQVRRPIYREGLDQWRHYEPWLGPLAQTLGPVLDAYPGLPAP